MTLQPSLDNVSACAVSARKLNGLLWNGSHLSVPYRSHGILLRFLNVCFSNKHSLRRICPLSSDGNMSRASICTSEAVY